MIRLTTTIPIARIALSFLLALLACWPTGPAEAQSPRVLLKRPDTWSAYILKESKGNACYMTSKPTQTAPKGVRRGEIWFLVTHRPARNIHDEVSIYIGYPFKPGSDVTVTVDKTKRFKLFTDGNIAWGDGPKQEGALVKAMISGGEMTVAGLSKRGTKTLDHYTLKGFTAAHKAISKACNIR